MVTGLVLQALLSYTVQSAGQLMTARIRSDLFDHALGLDLRFHLRTPVGLLLTRLTSDVGGSGRNVWQRRQRRGGGAGD